MRKLNLRIVAFCLFLVFNQKGGVRLWLHACLHARHPSPYSSHTIRWERNQLLCTCLDDLMMPLAAAQPFELSLPGKDYIIYITTWPSPVFSLTRHYPSLRGPPLTA